MEEQATVTEEERPKRAKASRPPKKKHTARTVILNIIGGIGEILVTAGLIVGLFAFWQVFVTDAQVAGERHAVTQKFITSTPEIPHVLSTDERTDDPPAWKTEVKHGDTLGVLHVPKWDDAVIPVEEGTDASVLDYGLAGHYTGTALPGEIGNFAVAGHRRSYGSNFRLIDRLGEGDVVVMQTKEAWLIYKYQSHEIVLPDQREVIDPVPNKPGEKPTERLMTMTTCHPEYGNSHRFIVHLKFDHWVPLKSGIPKELWKG